MKPDISARVFLKTRKAGTATAPASTIFINSSATEDSTSTLQLQHLRDRQIVSAPLGSVIAFHCWGGARG